MISACTCHAEICCSLVSRARPGPDCADLGSQVSVSVCVCVCVCVCVRPLELQKLVLCVPSLHKW